MADRTVKLRDLTRILARYGVGCDTKRGKGSHVMFFNDQASYPVPNRDDVLVAYARGCRKRFGLRIEDGVSDKDFYGK